MEKKNIGMKITIVILCLLVIGLSGYIVYDKVLIEDNDKCADNNITNENESNNSQNEEENIGFVKPSEHVELEENLKSELLEVFNFVHDYHHSHIYGNYCVGNTDANDIIDPPSGSHSIHKYNIASSEFTTFNKMIDYLKNFMTVNVIFGSELMDRDNFVEKDGKLYCPIYETGKGGVGWFDGAKIKYSKPYENVIYATIETTWALDEFYGGESYNQAFNVIFSKKVNKWVISSYEQIYLYNLIK